MDGLLALELGDPIVSVFGSVSQISDRTVRPVDVDVKRNQKSQGKINVMVNIDSVPSNVQSSRQEALLYVFEDNEAVIKMIIKGRSPTMRHGSRTHRVALDWLFDRINLDPKIQIKYIDTKNQLADMLTKGNFTRDEWNHLLCLFNISHFSSTACTAAMAKRAQQYSGGERVTAKSRPMMNLIARTPSVVSSSTSVSPGKRSYGSQNLWRSSEGEDRSGRPDKGTDLFEASDHHHHEQFMESFSSASYSKLDDDRDWSSQEWKTETTKHDRSGQPDKTSWRMVRKVRPGLEEILLDGTAQSVRNEEALRDRSRVAGKVVLYCSNRAFICSHALILLSQTRLDCGSLFVYKHRSTALVQTRLNGDSLFVYKHQSPALCFKHVWFVVPCLSTSISLQPCVSNTLELRFFVCVHASVNSPLFQTRLIIVACLFTSISLEPKWQRLTWITPCKCLVFRVVGMVMGTSTVA